MSEHRIIFVVNLLQDVNILRPLVYMAAKDCGRRPFFLVTGAFRKRDKTGLWQQELAEIIADTRADTIDFDHEFDALRALRDKSGILIAASESHLSAHKPVHDLFRVAPPRFKKVTLQHGFECVGFLQSRDQDLAHGASITFAADIICGWCEPERLTSVVSTQRHKLYVTGPTAVLQMPAPAKPEDRLGMGLVCENMHSPRLNTAGDFKSSFLDVFQKYCEALHAEGRRVALRPHPGGQYTLKNNVSLPENVEISNAPIYKTDLSRYAYGISAPSSILIDMVLADIPVAVWQDQQGIMDLGNYEGLTRISTVEEWVEFSRAASLYPETFIEKQRRFIERQRLVISPSTVYARYAELIGLTARQVVPAWEKGLRNEKVLFVANANIPTLQLSFTKPLEATVLSGNMKMSLITEEQLRRMTKKNYNEAGIREWLHRKFEEFRPTIVVFCRYSGPHAQWMYELSAMRGVPAVFHIDDDLLNIPEDIGLAKYRFHNQPERLGTVRYLLENATLVYCSTPRLKNRLIELGIRKPIVSGEIYCAGRIISPARQRATRKIGYMGIGHEKNLESILRALVRYLEKYEHVVFEFFGTIPVPREFARFGERVRHAPNIDDYELFLQRFAEYEWDIGICPLTKIPFNLLKANTKWVEYTSVGAAVVASKGTVYDECCADGCGILADTEEEWFAALDYLTQNPEARYNQVRRAQDKLRDLFSTERLREQVFDIFSRAHELNIRSQLKEAVP